MTRRRILSCAAVLAMFCCLRGQLSWAQDQPLTSACTPGSTCPLSGGRPPTISPAASGAFAAMSMGLFTYSKTDLALPGPMPITITRTYRSSDKDSTGNDVHDFGRGTTLNYSIFLYSNSEVSSGVYSNGEVVMPDGSLIKCVGNGVTIANYQSASFTCALQPTGIWFGSTIAWNPSTSQWNLTRKDGTVYAFGYSAPLASITDRYHTR